MRQSSDSPVAASLCELRRVIMAAKAGVTTVEHGLEPSDEALHAMKAADSIYVPALAAYEL